MRTPESRARDLATAALAASFLAACAPPAIEVTVDPRIELVAVIQTLVDGYPIRTQYDFEYRREVLERFSPYKDHRAVKRFEAMASSGFAFDAPIAAMLHLSEPPDLAEEVPLPAELLRRAGGRQAVDELLAEMSRFARESGFPRFFADHASFYEELVARERAKLGSIDVRDLEEYFGTRQHGYHIVLSPLLHHGGFGPRVAREHRGRDVYHVGGPTGAQDDRPIFGTEESLRHLVWHEFGHSFVNSLAEPWRERIAGASPLFEPIRERMAEQGYGTWETVVEEHVIRAVTVRLTHRELGPAAGAAALAEEVERGFVYVPSLSAALERYEANRRPYPTFESFYPEIVRTLEALAGAADEAGEGAGASPPPRG